MIHRLRVTGHVLRLTIKTNPWLAGLIIAIVVTQSGTIALVALAQRWLVDDAGLGVTIGLVGAALLGALAYTANAAGNRIQRNLRIDLSERVDVELTQEILAISATIPTVEHLERADCLDRIATLRSGVGTLAASCWAMAEMSAAFVSLGMTLWLLASVDVVLALLAVLGVPPLLTARRSQKVIRAALDANAESSRHERQLHELCVRPDSAKEIQIARNGHELGERADRLWEAMVRRESRARIVGALWQCLGWVCFAAGFALTVILVIRLAVDRQASLGDIVLVISLASRLRDQIALAVYSVNEVAEAGSVAEHYAWLRDYARTTPNGTGPAPDRLVKGIRLVGVRFRYPGASTDALTGVDLDVRAGSTVALVGVNGAGKSTLVKLLTGMYRPTGGWLEIDGQRHSQLDSHAWFAACSGVFQDFVKFQLTVRRTVGVGDLRHLDDQPRVCGAVERAGATMMVDALPDGLDTQLGHVFGGVELSHGQWQRLALARGVLRNQPLLMVLDEPTAALDPDAEHELFERFVAASRLAGAITVLVSHRFSTVYLADHIVVVDGGCVVEQGSHDDLLRHNGLYASLYRVQAQGYT